ncbi:MAG: glucose-1-phosphate adenylyltransferase subunit GlgD [Oscillospiraceae bacterium]|nr:glucose-1-phosphate adenylyltransferase subunit GlgD [Oscillospiraceae bacterium]
MKNVHGIIYAYHDYNELRELSEKRTLAALPFCGRYRLIDFSLSAMMHAGIYNVGVIMQRDYQSLIDHLGNGRAWNMGRRTGGLRMLPPFGVPGSHTGQYEGCMEALRAVLTYISEIDEDYVVLTRGDLCASVDLAAALERHMSSGADVTAVCTERELHYTHHRFIPDENGFASELVCMQQRSGRGVASLEMYILSKKLLLELVEWSSEGHKLHFHRDALLHLMANGGRVALYMHKGYGRHIISVADFYEANMDMLSAQNLEDLFTERPVNTRERTDVSTYYSDVAAVKNSLVADGCIIEGEVENSVIFCGVKIDAGASVKNCIVMNDTVVGEGSTLEYIISDKNVSIAPYSTLRGSPNLPFVIPKKTVI